MDVLNEFPLVDEHGKRYREFGRGCREYAPTIVLCRYPYSRTVPSGGHGHLQAYRAGGGQTEKGLSLFEQPIPRM